MKKLLSVLTLLLPLVAFAQTKEATMVREGDQMKVSADFLLDKAMLKGIKAFILTPQITDGESVVKLKPIGMYTKQKFYPYLEPYGFDGSAGELSYSKDQLPTVVRYNTSVPYERWMDGAELQLVHEYEGCCGDSGVEAVDSLSTYNEAPIQYAASYRPVARELTLKSATMGGSATIDFPVNSTKLSENYHNNAAELDKISQTIEALTNNDDIVLQSVVIVAQSSPEGKYEVNERLANERAKAVLDYVKARVELPDELIRAEGVAEDWVGTRKFVEESELKNKDQIIAIIENDELAPDVKEQRIRSRYSTAWNSLMKDCFPYLRRTYYKIDFMAVDVESGNTQLDLANKAMAAGNYGTAAEHLAKAGDSAEAEYARGTYFANQGNYQEAALHYQKAADGGIEAAQALADELNRVNYMRPAK